MAIQSHGGALPEAKAGSATPYILPPALTIETAEQLAAEFKQWPLAESTTVTLDTSQVETITTPGLQLLVALEKTLSHQGGTLILAGARREAITAAFRDSGLERMLGKTS